jgi:hypothetical protein
MKTIETHCADCNHQLPIMPKGHCGGAGYAALPDGSRICYQCADKRQAEDLKDRSKPFTAYVSEGIITTWTGGKLMAITRSKTCKLSRWSWTHGKTIQAIQARDVHGKMWCGRGSAGIAINLRPIKG